MSAYEDFDYALEKYAREDDDSALLRLFEAERAKVATLREAGLAVLPYIHDHVARLGIGDSRIAMHKLEAAIAKARPKPTEQSEQRHVSQ